MSEHTKDGDCTLVDDICTECGVWHADPCPDCGGRGFHEDGCRDLSEAQAEVERHRALELVGLVDEVTRDEEKEIAERRAFRRHAEEVLLWYERLVVAGMNDKAERVLKAYDRLEGYLDAH